MDNPAFTQKKENFLDSISKTGRFSLIVSTPIGDFRGKPENLSDVQIFEFLQGQVSNNLDGEKQTLTLMDSPGNVHFFPPEVLKQSVLTLSKEPNA